MFSRRSVFTLFASALAFAVSPFRAAGAGWGTVWSGEYKALPISGELEAEIFAAATDDIDLDGSITGIADAARGRMLLIGRHPPSFAKYFADPEGWNGEV